MNDGIASWRMEMRKTSGNYRATFDPWTALGYIRTDGDMQQFQIFNA